MADESAAIALDASAPAEERYDAQVEFAKATGALANQLLPTADMQRVISYIDDQWEMAKASRSNLVIGPWGEKKRMNVREGRSVIVDEYQILAQGEFWDKPGVLGFDAMRSMVEQTPILNAIMLTRIRQVTAFCRPRAGDSGPGFVIRHVDQNRELDEAGQQSVQLLQKFMLNGGWEFDPRRRKRLKRDTLQQFMAKSIRDSLTLDAAPIETVFKVDRKLGLDGFHAVDGATIRLCTEEGYEGDDEIFAVQLLQGNIRTTYNYDQLVYEVRNPRTDVTACGYGYSETEMLIRVVTYLLNALTYNGTFFDKNSIPRGILHLAGAYSPEDLAAFKRHWNAMLRGADNAHNLPIMVSKDQESAANYTEIGGQLDEMAFAKWLSFLTSIACSIYGTAPEDISMESFAANKASLSGSDTGEKLASSNDKGLKPLLSHNAAVITDYIIRPFSEDYEFAFVGLDDEDEKNRFEMRKLALTWNEARQSVGLDAVPGKIGDVPINPSLIPTWSLETGIGVPEQPEGDFGDPDAAEAGDEGQVEDGPPGEPGEDGDVDDGQPDFGPAPGAEGDDDGDEMAKALAEADFGLPPAYVIEV